MRISVVLQSPTSATVTREPGWFSRLVLGSRESTVWANRIRVIGAGSRYARIYDDHREVEPEVADAIERAITLRAVRERREALVRK